MIRLTELRPGERVRITWEGKRSMDGAFLELLGGEFKGGRFMIDGRPVSIMVAELTAEWVKIERA
jgi:hypothetical protein